MEWIQITPETVLPNKQNLLFREEMEIMGQLYPSYTVGHTLAELLFLPDDAVLSDFTHYCLITEPTVDHTAAYHALQESIFIPAIMEKALPKITGDLTEGKISWRGIFPWYEQVSDTVERTWVQQREERISPVIEFDLSTGEYSLID